MTFLPLKYQKPSKYLLVGTERRTDGGTDNRQKVITIAHPEHSSDELIMYTPVDPFSLCKVALRGVSLHRLVNMMYVHDIKFKMLLFWHIPKFYHTR